MWAEQRPIRDSKDPTKRKLIVACDLRPTSIGADIQMTKNICSECGRIELEFVEAFKDLPQLTFHGTCNKCWDKAINAKQEGK